MTPFLPDLPDLPDLPVLPALIAGACIIAALLAAFAAAAMAGRFGLISTALPDQRIGHIDGLRGYLAVFVLIHHFAIWQRLLAGYGWRPHPVYVLNNLGQSAVFLFFMVTGALFYSRVVTSETPPDWLSVYTSRIFRLTPLYWFAVLLVVLLAIGRAKPNAFPPDAYVRPALQWLSYFGMPGFPGYPAAGQIIAYTPWTLTYEWRFYFSLPFLYVVYRYARPKGVPMPMLIGAVLATCAIDIYFVSGTTFRLVAPFVFGMLALEVSKNRMLCGVFASRWCAAAGAIALATEMLSFPHATGFTQYMLLAVFFIPVVCGNSYFGILSRPASVGLGEISYSVYLLHGIVLSFFMVEVRSAFDVQPASEVGWPMLPILAVAVVLVSAIAHGLIERPGIRLGKQIAGSLRKRLERTAV